LKKTSPSSNSKDNKLEKEQYLYLRTRGRKSGLPREIEIWFTHRDEHFYVIAEYASSNWIQNLVAYPEVQVTRVIPSETDLSRAVRQLSRDKYGWGDGLIVELTPENQELKTEN
jgi:deazaflavin-dependent oxidoreductase (nitroreductase family)